MFRVEMLLVAYVVISQSYASPFPEDFSTDRALCTYFGCSTNEEIVPIQKDNELLKRPFCNGFRGCANGKRALIVKTKTVSDTDPSSDNGLEAVKRPFCNGFRGCANGKRSNVLDRDQLWFLQRLLENISRPERRDTNVINEDGELRRRRRSVGQLLRSISR